MNPELCNRAIRRCEELKATYRMILLECVHADRRVAELAQKRIALYATAMYRLRAKLTCNACSEKVSPRGQRDRAADRKKLAALFAERQRGC
jgi:hypothetical protein